LCILAGGGSFWQNEENCYLLDKAQVYENMCLMQELILISKYIAVILIVPLIRAGKYGQYL